MYIKYVCRSLIIDEDCINLLRKIFATVCIEHRFEALDEADVGKRVFATGFLESVYLALHIVYTHLVLAYVVHIFKTHFVAQALRIALSAH